MGYNAQVKHSLIIHLKQLSETRTLLKSKCAGMAVYLLMTQRVKMQSDALSPHAALSHDECLHWEDPRHSISYPGSCLGMVPAFTQDLNHFPASLLTTTLFTVHTL